MKKNITANIIALAIVGVLLSASFAFAQPGGTPGSGPGGTPGSPSGGTVTFPNPLGNNVTSYKDVVANVIQGVLGIVGVAALIIFIYGGIVWMTSLGNSERVKQGRDTLVWGAIGLVVVFASFAVVNLILGALEST